MLNWIKQLFKDLSYSFIENEKSLTLERDIQNLRSELTERDQLIDQLKNLSH